MTKVQRRKKDTKNIKSTNNINNTNNINKVKTNNEKRDREKDLQLGEKKELKDHLKSVKIN
jgi:hypothetical protein